MSTPHRSQPALDERGGASFADAWHRTTVSQVPRPTSLVVRDGTVVLETEVVVDPGASVSLAVEVVVERLQASAFDADPGATGVTWDQVQVAARDERLVAVVGRGLDDGQHLLLRDPQSADDVFAEPEPLGISRSSVETRSGRRA